MGILVDVSRRCCGSAPSGIPNGSFSVHWSSSMCVAAVSGMGVPYLSMGLMTWLYVCVVLGGIVICVGTLRVRHSGGA